MREQFRFCVFHCYTNQMKTLIIFLGTPDSSQKCKSNNKYCFNSNIYNVIIYVCNVYPLLRLQINFKQVCFKIVLIIFKLFFKFIVQKLK